MIRETNNRILTNSQISRLATSTSIKSAQGHKPYVNASLCQPGRASAVLGLEAKKQKLQMVYCIFTTWLKA